MVSVIPLASWLDPRSEAKPAILSSVNIPVAELPKRVHELPSRNHRIQIADVGEEAVAAWAWLDSMGRPARIVTGFRFGESEKHRLWSPNAFLEDRITELSSGTALDLACGTGRDAVFLASCGFEVTAVDHLPDAIVRGQNLEERYLRRAMPIHWLCGDLKGFGGEGRFDLITCFYYLDRQLLSSIPSLLAPGGSVVMETFTTEHRVKFGKPQSEELVLQPGELPEIMHGLEIKSYEEAWHGDRHTARLWAQSGR